MNCGALNCERGNGCCRVTNNVAYCEVSSICKDDPIWQAIVIPAVIFLLAVILIIVTWCKLKDANKQTMKVRNFAHQEMYLCFYLVVWTPNFQVPGCPPSPAWSDPFIFNPATPTITTPNSHSHHLVTFSFNFIHSNPSVSPQYFVFELILI